jgi:multiple antibiotic resistance protein
MIQTLSKAAVGESDLSLGMIFTAFFVMLGPEHLIYPFGKLTEHMSEADVRKTASKAFAFSCGGGLVAAVIGSHALHSWRLSHSVLHLAGGLILMLVALQAVLAQYRPESDRPVALPASTNLALVPVTFPIILSPHGIAILILLLAEANTPYQDAGIVVLFLLVMGLDWIAMWFGRPIVRRGHILLTMAAPILTVLQVALAAQMMIAALRSLHIIAAE